MASALAFAIAQVLGQDVLDQDNAQPVLTSQIVAMIQALAAGEPFPTPKVVIVPPSASPTLDCSQANPLIACLFTYFDQP